LFDLNITIDLIIVLTCAGLLIRFGRLSHSHPGTIYLFFHLYTFTSRLIAIAYGAPTLFSEWGPQYRGVTEDEIIRAVWIGDVALILMTGAWIKAAADDRRAAANSYLAEKIPNLSFKHIALVGRFTFPLGVVALLAFSYIPQIENVNLYMGEWETSSWILTIQSWAGLSLLVFIFWSGFRWHLILPMAIYVGIMSVQGYHRFRIVLPVLLMLQIYLDRNNLRWPPLRVCAMLLGLLILFFPLKDIGKMVRRGASFDQIVASASDTVKDAATGQADDQAFLDQYASALTLIDENGKYYYGTPYLALLTLPVPRVLWADKPGLADHMADFSRPSRPMKEAGMILTFIGDAYANFWYFGVVVVPFLLAYWLGRFYFRAYRENYYSVTRFMYLMLAVNLIQVYRDGLLSIFIFTVVNMFPLVLIVVLHYFFPVKKRLRRMAPAFNQPARNLLP
jgi:hypothetical protein